MPTIRFDLTLQPVLVLLLVTAGILAGIWYYRATIPPVPLRTRILLTLLRSTALALLFFLLAQPLLRLQSVFTSPPAVAVLLDNSMSMRIAGSTGTRAAVLQDLLHSDALRSIGASAELRFYTFGIGLSPLPDPDRDTLTVDAEATNISAALTALVHERGIHRFDAALLLSDGAATLGRNPIYDADAPGIPLYTIGIGDTTDPHDVAITAVAANRIVYQRVATPVDVTVRSSAARGEQVRVRLLHNNREITHNTLTLAPGMHEYRTSLSYIPDEPGLQRLTAEVDILPGEITSTNNRLLFGVRVLKSKLRIVLVAGSPGPDVATIAQTLREEGSLTVQTFTQRGAAGYFGPPPRQQEIDSADCLVLVGFPTSATPDATLRLFIGKVTAGRLPLLLIGGKELDYEKLRSFGPAIPFTVDAFAPNEQLITAVVAEPERLHPLVALDQPEGSTAWDRLPPLFRTLAFYRARPESRTLVRGKSGAATSDDPLVVLRSVAGQKTIAVTAYGLWRWRLQVQHDPQTRNHLAQFLGASIRWLTSPEESRPFRVTPIKDVFVRGEPIGFTAQLYNALALPVDNARITVRIRDEAAPVASELRPLGNGRYDGELEGLGEGEYTYEATAEVGGMQAGYDRGRVTVGGISLELMDTRPNYALLRSLAGRSGGRFFLSTDLGGLDSTLRADAAFTPRSTRRALDLELWHWHYLLAAVILLFALEWIIRRRAGML